VEDKRFIFIALMASTLTIVIPDTVFLLTFPLQFSARPIKTAVVLLNYEWEDVRSIRTVRCERPEGKVLVH